MGLTKIQIPAMCETMATWMVLPGVAALHVALAVGLDLCAVRAGCEHRTRQCTCWEFSILSN
jgi:hypothetical protein